MGIRRVLGGAAGVAVAATAVGVSTVGTAHAVVQEFTQTVDLSTTINGMGHVTFPQGTMASTFDTDNGNLAGTINLPEGRFSTPLVGLLPYSDVYVRVEPVGPASGRGDFQDNITVQQEAVFRFTAVRPKLTPWINLVGDGCRSRQPVTLTFSGNQNATLSGNFRMPSFTDCGVLTSKINILTAGRNNSLRAKLVITSGDNNH